MEALSKEKELAQLQRQFRKAETEAVVPHFAMLRAEAHFRYNKLIRLRQVYREAVAQVKRQVGMVWMDLSDCLTIELTEADQLVVSEVGLCKQHGEMGHDCLCFGFAELSLELREFLLFTQGFHQEGIDDGKRKRLVPRALLRWQGLKPSPDLSGRTVVASQKRLTNAWAIFGEEIPLHVGWKIPARFPFFHGLEPKR